MELRNLFNGRFRRFVAISVFVCTSFLSNSLHGQTMPIYPLTTSSFIATTQTPAAFTTGDFNGDGLPDIASVSLNYATVPTNTLVTIMLGTSTASSYTSSTAASLACSAIGNLQAVDLNKDGKQDLALVCGGYAVVLLGHGDGTFAAPAYYAVQAAVSLAVADLNGDGNPDLAVVSAPTTNSASITLLLNAASSPGTFTTGSTYAAGTAVSGALANLAVAGDFNGDGKQDLLVNFPNPMWSVFYGNGDGTLQAVASTPATGGLVARDVNQDGITDVVYPTTDATGKITTIQTLFGSSSGLTAGPLAALPNLTPGGTLSFAGSTGNGANTDLAYVNILSGSAGVASGPLSILLGDGKGGFTLGQSYSAAGVSVAQTASGGGTNLLVYVAGAGYLVLTSNGDGTFQGQPAQPLPSGFQATVADINGDGLTDVIAAVPAGNLVSLLSRGDGTFTTVSSVPALSSAAFLNGDFSGDGKLDVIGYQGGVKSPNSAYYQAPQVSFFAGQGNGVFTAGVNVPLNLSTTYPVIDSGAVGDFNGDGKLDVLFAISCIPVLYPGNGDGTFAAPVVITHSCGNASSPVLVADLNGDGKLDFIYDGTVFLGNGMGAFQQTPIGISSIYALGDLNGDGYRDIVATSSENFSAYAGLGNGTFQTSPFFTKNYGFPCTAFGFSIGDAHASNIADLAAACLNVNGVGVLLLNLGTGGGSFVSDSNQYFLNGDGVTGGNFARLNKNSPSLATDQSLDYLGFVPGGIVSLINTHNVAPSLTPTTTQLSVAPGSLSFGAQETFTATVLPATAGGTITFMNGSTALGTGTIMNGVATFSTSTLTAGSYSVTALYAATGVFTASSSAPAVFTVAKAATTTTLAVSPISVNSLQTVTFTATVGNGATGTVTFTVNGAALPAATITGGVASVQDNALSAGTYTILASYSGDANHAGSTSAAGSVSVVAPDFSITANPTALTITRGQSGQAIFTVMPVGGYTGIITLTCGALPPQVSCALNPSTLSISSTSSAISTLTLSTTAPGSALSRTSALHIAGSLVFGALMLFWPSRLRKSPYRLVSMLGIFVAAALSGCGSNSGGTMISGSPLGTSSLTITATTPTASHSVSLPITIQ